MSETSAVGDGGARLITIRSVIIGLLCGMALAAVAYYNDAILGMSQLAGSHLPLGVYGLLIFTVLFIAPPLSCLSKWFRVRPSEYAVVICIMLASASVVTDGMVRMFIPTVAMPANHFHSRTDWPVLTKYMPDNTILGNGGYDERTVGGLMTGLSEHGRHIDVSKVPWDAWNGLLVTWLPTIGLVLAIGFSMVTLVHRQWARRERLAFPLVQFADTIISGRCPGSSKSLFGSYGFWWAFGAVFFIHIVNGLNVWFPSETIKIPLGFDLTKPFINKFPTLRYVWDTYHVFGPTIIFAVVGFSFFVPKDVSFTIALGGPLHTILIAYLMSIGINLHAGPDRGNYLDFLRLGGYIGLAVMIFYNGRAYYRAVFARALGFSCEGRRTGEGVWSARILLAAFAGLTLVLHYRFGMDVPVAILTVALMLLMFLILTRLSAETGLFYINSGYVLPDMVGATFGDFALGPQNTFTTGLFGVAMVGSNNVILPGLAIHGLELAERKKVSEKKVIPWMAIMLVLALAISLFVVIYSVYDKGIIQKNNDYIVNWMAKSPYEWLSRSAEVLGDRIGESANLSWWQRITNINPMRGLIPGLLVGFLLTLALGFMRRRYARWPIHPMIVALFGVYTVANFCFSFLVGWLLRVIIDSLTGGAGSRKFRPFMVGLIVGHLMAALFWLAVGGVYYLKTGILPRAYAI